MTATATVTPHVGDHVRVRLPTWLTQANNLPSRELVGTVTRVTEKALLLDAKIALRDATRCLRCGALDTTRGYCATHLADAQAAVDDRRHLWLPQRRLDIADELIDLEVWDRDRATVGRAAATVADGKLWLATDYEHRELAKAVGGGTWRKGRKQWEFPASPATAARIAEIFADDGLGTDSAFQALLAAAADVKEAQAAKTAAALPDVPGSKTPAWLHQKAAFWFAEKLQAAMLAMDMGTGKSKVAIDLIGHHGHKLVLIVAPINASKVWPKQFRLHAGSDIRVTRLTGRGKLTKKVEEAESEVQLCAAIGKPLVLIINYESVWRNGFADFVLAHTWDLIICDESQKIKGATAKASVFMAKVSRSGRARTRLCLTGTPMPHSPLDIYGQYRFLDPGIFGTSYNRFKQRYAVWGGFGGYQLQGYTITEVDPKTGQPNPHYNEGMEREWNERLWSIAYHVPASVLDLPGVHMVDRTTELEPASRKLYAELDEFMVTQVGGGTLTASNALTKLLRLQQLTSGHLLDDNGERIHLAQEKRKLFAEVLDELPLDEPVVVFARFTADLDAIAEVAQDQGRRYGELSGRRNDALTEDATMSLDVDVAGVQIQSGGTGIDFTRAHYCIYYSVGYSLGDYDQSRKRLDRPGQTHPVTYVHLLVEDSVDELVYAALKNRKSVIDYVVEDMKQRHAAAQNGESEADADEG